MKFSLSLLLLLFAGLARAEGTVLEAIPLQNRPAEELRALLAPLLESGDQVADNGVSLIVRTAPSRLENIRALVKKLDVKLSNLLVSVIQNSSRSAAQLNAEASLTYTQQGFRMQGMNADTRDLSSNKLILRTLEGQAALIKTGKIKPQQNINFYGSINGNPIVGGATQMIETSSGFAVTPRLSGQQVLIDIEPWSEQFRQGYNIETQAARTTIQAKLGEWVEIAGNDTSSQTHQGFNSFNQNTLETNLRILIKVDKAD